MKTKAKKARIVSFTIGRLYNLGNYENIKYDLCVEVPLGESVAKAMTVAASILRVLRPKGPCQKYEYEHAKKQLEDPEAWHKNLEPPSRRKREIRLMVKSAKKLVADYERWLRLRKIAGRWLDNLGGSVTRKDAKLDWQDSDDWV